MSARSRNPRRCPWPSPMCKRLGSLLVHPVTGAEVHHDAAGFASCCGPVICSPPHRDFVTPLRPTTSRSQPGVSYQDPGVSPDRTCTGWLSRASARLRHDRSFALKRPSCWTHVDPRPTSHLVS